MILGLKSKLYTAGAAIMAALAFFVRLQYLKNSNEKLQRKADTLEARVIQDKIIKKREQEVKGEFRSRSAALAKELEKKDDKPEEFEGLHNLNKPNDW